MTAAPQAPVVCILDSGTNEAGAEGWNYLAGNEDLTDEAGHGDLIYQLLESETPNARLIVLKCFESAEETEEKNYFTAHSAMCNKVKEQFPLFNENYIDELMDERYNEYCDSIN